jgi:diguanylate cyclase (GGDEF)-like protein
MGEEAKNCGFDSGMSSVDELIVKKNILLLESKVENLEISKKILMDDYNVIVAQDVRLALRIMQDNYRIISLIMVDVEMNDCFWFLEEICKVPELAAIPIIVTTDDNEADKEEKSLEFGAVDFILRPYNNRIVLARVKNVIYLRESAAALSAVMMEPNTGLYTKQAFIHHAEMLLSANPGKVYMLIGIDIVNSKLTNSQYGEKRCSEFLDYVGKSLGELEMTLMAGRYSNDQFIIMVEKSEQLTSRVISSKIQSIVKEAPIAHQSVKIGVYDKLDGKISVISCCDRAFWAIRTIKGIYNEYISYYTEELREQLITEQRIQDSMEDALEKGQFKVYYQPKHNCKTRQVSGAEALVRWNHSEYGFMAPARFIPLFEKNGFITRLDSYVVEQVCKDMVDWEQKGIDVVPVSINISRRDFYEEGWMDKQLDAISRYSIDPKMIHMEVTESLYTGNADTIIEHVKKVQKRGYEIEMDDFGSGYSSLGMLNEFPLDIVKLDISFIRRIEQSDVVIDSVISMAHRMGLKTIAEGVETQAQFVKLKELGCDYIQGFYFSRPLPKEEFERYLMDHKGIGVLREQDDDVAEQWRALSNELEIKNILLECVNSLVSEENEQSKLRHLLSVIAKFYGATCAYVVEFDKERNIANCTFEWDSIGGEYKKKYFRDKDMAEIDIWLKAFGEHDAYYVKSIKDIEDKNIYRVLLEQGINGIMSVPLLIKKERIGFLSVDNPTMNVESMLLLRAVTSFVVTEIERNRYISLLENISFVDSLTGLKNRTAYDRDIAMIESDELNNKKPMGVVFADINGLKSRNDNVGHEAGDMLIQDIANLLKTHFNPSHIYRIGGDEFVILSHGKDKNKFYSRVEKLKQSCNEDVSAAIGGKWIDEARNFQESIALADKEMYEDKTRYYLDKGHDRRRH